MFGEKSTIIRTSSDWITPCKLFHIFDYCCRHSVTSDRWITSKNMIEWKSFCHTNHLRVDRLSIRLLVATFALIRGDLFCVQHSLSHFLWNLAPNLYLVTNQSIWWMWTRGHGTNQYSDNCIHIFCVTNFFVVFFRLFWLMLCHLNAHDGFFKHFFLSSTAKNVNKNFVYMSKIFDIEFTASRRVIVQV